MRGGIDLGGTKIQAVVVDSRHRVRGEEYVRRIEAAMRPHVFADQPPPDVHLAALGDLGGAIGASLLAARLDGVRATRSS